MTKKKKNKIDHIIHLAPAGTVDTTINFYSFHKSDWSQNWENQYQKVNVINDFTQDN